MSNAQIKPPPSSPPVPLLASDSKANVSQTSVDRGASSSHVEQSQPVEVTGTASAGKQPQQSAMSFPFDENLFYSAPEEPDQPTNEDAAQYEEPAQGQLLPPPDFKPFFTLVEDPDTGEHRHPTVHYLFADEEPAALTSASLELLDAHKNPSHQIAQSIEPEERFVVVDMEADGKTVASVQSMSADWQVLKTTVRQAPSWGDDDNNPDRGLMLSISGRQSSSGTLKDKKLVQKQKGSIDDLVKAFGERLDALDEVLGRRTGTAEK